MPHINNPSPNKKNKIHPLILLSIGISAGAITAFFPRIVTLISINDIGESFDLFPRGFIIAGVVFSFLVGIAMLWLYWGTTENTRQLFLAALGLPALLSGTFNMQQSSQSFRNIITEKNEEYRNLSNHIDKLSKANGIKVDESQSIDDQSNSQIIKESELNIFRNLSIIPCAFAQEYTEQMEIERSNTFNTGISYKKEQSKETYYLVLAQSANQNIIDSLKHYYSTSFNLTDLWISNKSGNFYLIKGNKMLKSNAQIEGMIIKNETELVPKLIKVNRK